MARKMQSFVKWIYKKRWTILVILLLVLMFLWFFGTNFYKIYDLNRQKADLQTQITEEAKRAEELNAEWEQVGSKAYIEAMARKYLKLFYPDEKVVVTVEENKDGGTPSTTAPKEETNE